MAHAINTTSMRKAGRIEYVLELKSLYLQPEIIHMCVGAIVNLRSEHWVALRSVAGQIWFLDSVAPSPRPLSHEDYLAYVNKHKGAYPIKFAENIGSALTSRSSLDDSPGGSPVLPVAASQDTRAEDSAMSTAADEPMPDAATSATTQGPSGPPVGDTSVPALMVAECHGPELRRNTQRAQSGWEGQVCCNACFVHLQAQMTPWKSSKRTSTNGHWNSKALSVRHARSTRRL